MVWTKGRRDYPSRRNQWRIFDILNNSHRYVDVNNSWFFKVQCGFQIWCSGLGDCRCNDFFEVGFEFDTSMFPIRGARWFWYSDNLFNTVIWNCFGCNSEQGDLICNLAILGLLWYGSWATLKDTWYNFSSKVIQFGWLDRIWRQWLDILTTLVTQFMWKWDFGTDGVWTVGTDLAWVLDS